MCLSCAIGQMTREQKEKLFACCSPEKTVVYTYDGKRINLTLEQKQEIIDKAITVYATSVDLSCDIWAIQWPNDYNPITFSN